MSCPEIRALKGILKNNFLGFMKIALISSYVISLVIYYSHDYIIE